jgi:hypothetical protein
VALDAEHNYMFYITGDRNMNKLAIGLVSLVAGLSSIVPAYAFPAKGVPVVQSELIQVRYDGHHGGHGDHVWHNHGRYDRGYSHHGGYRHYDHDGNAGAIIGGLAAGAIIGGILASQPHYRTNSHAQYCADRYRSYRAYDNTFQPNSGQRVQCR